MLKKSIVYRIEDESGCGVYRGTRSLYNYEKFCEFEKDRVHPMPRKDSKLMASLPKRSREIGFFGEESIKSLFLSEFVFGFSSPEQLRAWFYEDEVLVWLGMNGFSLVVYNGYAHHGNSQSIVKKGSKKIQKISLADFLAKKFKI